MILGKVKLPAWKFSVYFYKILEKHQVKCENVNTENSTLIDERLLVLLQSKKCITLQSEMNSCQIKLG